MTECVQAFNCEDGYLVDYYGNLRLRFGVCSALSWRHFGRLYLVLYKICPLGLWVLICARWPKTATLCGSHGVVISAMGVRLRCKPNPTRLLNVSVFSAGKTQFISALDLHGCFQVRSTTRALRCVDDVPDTPYATRLLEEKGGLQSLSTVDTKIYLTLLVWINCK